MIALLIFIFVVAIVAGVVLYIVSLLPLQAPWGNIARICVLLIALLVILARVLPALGVNVS